MDDILLLKCIDNLFFFMTLLLTLVICEKVKVQLFQLIPKEPLILFTKPKMI